jgi:hypothetical protein
VIVLISKWGGGCNYFVGKKKISIAVLTTLFTDIFMETTFVLVLYTLQAHVESIYFDSSLKFHLQVNDGSSVI